MADSWPKEVGEQIAHAVMGAAPGLIAILAGADWWAPMALAALAGAIREGEQNLRWDGGLVWDGRPWDGAKDWGFLTLGGVLVSAVVGLRGVLG